MGSNPSKKANTFSSATLNKNENSDKFLVSKPLKKEKDEEVRIKTEDLSKASNIKNNFSEDQLIRLEKLFKYLDLENRGYIKLDDFKGIYEIKVHAFKLNNIKEHNYLKEFHLRERIYEMIDLTLEEMHDEINYETFLKVLSIFHPKTEKERKIKFLFRMYDIDEDDQISINDICDFYRMMYIENYKELLIDNKIQDPNVNKHLMNENVIQKISKEMIENFDLDGDGCLNMNEFRKAVGDFDLENRMNIYF